MEPLKRTILKITPQTHVRSTKGDSWLFAVSDDYLKNYDSKRCKDDDTLKPGRNLNRKRQLQKYNKYKDDLRMLCACKGFVMPTGYFSIWFCMPHPPSWRKSKIIASIGEPHESVPDLDNLLKAFFDGIMPRKNKTKKEMGCDDRKIHSYAAFKVWVEQENACIEIVEYKKQDFLSAFSDTISIE